MEELQQAVAAERERRLALEGRLDSSQQYISRCGLGPVLLPMYAPPCAAATPHLAWHALLDQTLPRRLEDRLVQLERLMMAHQGQAQQPQHP